MLVVQDENIKKSIKVISVNRKMKLIEIPDTPKISKKRSGNTIR